MSEQNGGRSLLEIAIEREEWELAAWCIVAGVMDAAASLPPEAVDELMEMLAADEAEATGRRRKRQRRYGRS